MDKPPRGWSAYAKQAESRPPDETLKEAVSLVREREAALDIGAGALNETRYLLKSGFKKVVAVDAEPGVAERAKSLEGNERLEAVTSRFEEYAFPSDYFDLVNARYSLPFMSADSFDEVFTKMKSSLKTEGIFVGQLFGKNDCRKEDKCTRTHTREEIDRLLADMEVLNLGEEEYDGPTSNGIQHWHVWQILARKK